MSASALRELLSPHFECQFVGDEPTASRDAAELARINSEQPYLAVGTSDGAWMIVTDSLMNDSLMIDSQFNERLVDRVNRVIDQATATQECLTSARLVEGPECPSKQSLAMFQSNPLSIQLIEPSCTSDELLKRAETGLQIPEFAARLSPGVPTGLTFLSTENPGGAGPQAKVRGS